MKIHGLPETFWVVATPTSQSELCDICFDYDFKRFVQNIRGGLDDEIVAIFADKSEAVEEATKLLRAIQQTPEKPDTRFQKSPWAGWFATQESLSGVVLCDKESSQRIVVEPPQEWGGKWAWNISPDGSGIVMCRTA